MRRFLASVLPSAQHPIVTLDVGVSHHLLRVTGIAPGEAVELFDGQGSGCEAVLEAVCAGRAVMRWSGERAVAVLPSRWLLAGMLRGPAFDTVIRMATELGVEHIWPVLLSRSVARGDRMARWERIAAAAAGQSGRAALPQLRSPAPLDRCLAALPDRIRRLVFLPGAPLTTPSPAPTALLLGCEGGLTGAETEAALEAGFTPAGLGMLTLRADTAAVAALSRLL